MQIAQMHPWLGLEEQAAAAEAIASGWVSEGPRAAAFSAQLNDLIGAPFGVFAPTARWRFTWPCSPPRSARAMK